MTFYKPIDSVFAEKMDVFHSLLGLSWVCLVFFIYASLFSVFSGFEFLFKNIVDNAIFFGGYFFAGLVYIPFTSFVIFLISRLFSRKGNIVRLVSLNYFIFASASLFILIFFVPLLEFAGLILFPLGVILYLYFLNELLEKMFELSPAKSILLTVIYVLFWLAPVLLWFLSQDPQFTFLLS